VSGRVGKRRVSVRCDREGKAEKIVIGLKNAEYLVTSNAKL